MVGARAIKHMQRDTGDRRGQGERSRVNSGAEKQKRPVGLRGGDRVVEKKGRIASMHHDWGPFGKIGDSNHRVSIAQIMQKEEFELA